MVKDQPGQASYFKSMYDPLAVVNSFKEKVLKFKNRSKKKNFVFFFKDMAYMFCSYGLKKSFSE